jgi:alcohol dehydrogenase (NADP+)
VGRNVSKFKVGDHAGVGTMVDSCGVCNSCKRGEEQHCDNNATLFTYGYPEKTSPTGITQGGYSDNIIVKERFAIKIPKTMRLQDAAPLLCAGVTTYSPLIKASVKKGDKVGVAGIGGLGHLAIKLAVAKGAEVYAFTTSESKVNDILRFGAKQAVVVDSVEKLKAYNKSLDYGISTIPVNYDVGAYASLVKPYGSYTQVGMPAKGEVTINNFAFNRNRVSYNTSLVGGIPQTQQLVDYCAKSKIYPEVQVIKANEANEAWEKVINKEARYRYVIDGATI